jgi:hypothetical protein
MVLLSNLHLYSFSALFWFFAFFFCCHFFLVFTEVCFSVLCRLTHSLSKSTRSKISSSLQEGKMRALWGSRRAKVLSSSRSVAPSTSTRFASSTKRRLTSWSSLSLLVSMKKIFFFFLIFWLRSTAHAWPIDPSFLVFSQRFNSCFVPMGWVHSWWQISWFFLAFMLICRFERARAVKIVKWFLAEKANK